MERKLSRRGLITVAAITLADQAPAAADSIGRCPYFPPEGDCPSGTALTDDGRCVPRSGMCRGKMWYCKKHRHPQFRCDLTLERPERCCRRNYPPRPGGNSRGRCWKHHARRCRNPVTTEVA